MASEDVDFEPEAEEEAEVEGKGVGDIAPAPAVKTKGRGHNVRGKGGSSDGRGGHFESVDDDAGGPGPAKSVEGWIIVVTGVHQDAQVCDDGGDAL